MRKCVPEAWVPCEGGIGGGLREGQPGGLVSAECVCAPLPMCVCMCTQDCPQPLLSQYMEKSGSSCSFLFVLCQRTYQAENSVLVSLGFPTEATFQKLFIVCGKDFGNVWGRVLRLRVISGFHPFRFSVCLQGVHFDNCWNEEEAFLLSVVE